MSFPLYTAIEIATATYGKLHNCDDNMRVTGVQFDSRLVEAGDVFFALSGEGADGHAYVKKAFDTGATLAVVAHIPEGCAQYPLVVVENTLRALEALGVAARTRIAAQRVAITGSVGKTSTKDMLAHVLQHFGRTHAAKASFNNHIGVPLTLARMPQNTQFGVFEIGMNHAGEITPLAGFVQPHVAMVTAVEPVHIEHFENIQGIALAKGEIFSGLVAGGVAIVNADAQALDVVLAAAKAANAHFLTYSLYPEAKANATITSMQLNAENSHVHATIGGVAVEYTIGAPGAHFAHNSLGVLLCVQQLGLDVAQAAAQLASFTPPKGRGQRFMLNVPNGQITLLDESYNANPASMRAALKVLAGTPTKGRRIAVLGQMLELGTHSHAAHEGLLAPIMEAKVDVVYCAGAAMQPLWDILSSHMRGAHEHTALALVPQLQANARAGDVLLIKGSNGSGVWRIVEALKTKI